jgi:hypothetical protein
MPAQRQHATRNFQPALLQGHSVVTVQVECCGSLLRRGGLLQFVARAGARVDGMDAVVVGEEQGRAATARRARKGATVAAAVRQWPTVIPQRHPEKPVPAATSRASSSSHNGTGAGAELHGEGSWAISKPKPKRRVRRPYTASKSGYSETARNRSGGVLSGIAMIIHEDPTWVTY